MTFPRRVPSTRYNPFAMNLEEKIAELKRRNQLAPVNELNQGVIPFSQVIRNNHLREHIRKVERSVFYLKYHVNKLLSIAS